MSRPFHTPLLEAGPDLVEVALSLYTSIHRNRKAGVRPMP